MSTDPDTKTENPYVFLVWVIGYAVALAAVVALLSIWFSESTQWFMLGAIVLFFVGLGFAAGFDWDYPRTTLDERTQTKQFGLSILITVISIGIFNDGFHISVGSIIGVVVVACSLTLSTLLGFFLGHYIGKRRVCNEEHQS